MSTIGADLRYDRASVVWVADYIERNRAGFSEQEANQVANTLGAFLGECLRETYGGRWTYLDDQGEWAIDLGPGLGTALPALKVYKHLRNGPADSIVSFFDVMGALVDKGGIEHL